MIPVAVAPYALVLSGGLLIGAASAAWVQQIRIDEMKVDARERDVQAREAAAEALRDADAASAKIAGLSTDLAAAWRHQRVVEVEVIKEIERVTSPSRACLGPAAVRVLQRADVRPAGAGESAGEPAQAVPGPAADPGRSTSERAVTTWIDAVQRQYRDLQREDAAKAEVIRELERAGLVVVVPD